MVKALFRVGIPTYDQAFREADNALTHRDMRLEACISRITRGSV